jgi:hypothetical protein
MAHPGVGRVDRDQGQIKRATKNNKLLPSPQRSCQWPETPTHGSRHRAIAVRERRRLAGVRAGDSPHTHASARDFHGDCHVSGLRPSAMTSASRLGRSEKRQSEFPHPIPSPKGRGPFRPLRARTFTTAPLRWASHRHAGWTEVPLDGRRAVRTSRAALAARAGLPASRLSSGQAEVPRSPLATAQPHQRIADLEVGDDEFE